MIRVSNYYVEKCYSNLSFIRGPRMKSDVHEAETHQNIDETRIEYSKLATMAQLIMLFQIDRHFLV